MLNDVANTTGVLLQDSEMRRGVQHFSRAMANDESERSGWYYASSVGHPAGKSSHFESTKTFGDQPRRLSCSSLSSSSPSSASSSYYASMSAPASSSSALTPSGDEDSDCSAGNSTSDDSSDDDENSNSSDISSVDEELATDLSAVLSAPPGQSVASCAPPGDDASDSSGDSSSSDDSSNDDNSSSDISSIDEALASDVLAAPPGQSVASCAPPGDDDSSSSDDFSDDDSCSSDISSVDEELARGMLAVLSAPPRQSVAPTASPGNDALDCSDNNSSSDDFSDDDSSSSADISSVDEELARDLSAVLSAPPRQSVASCAPPGDDTSDCSDNNSSSYDSSDDDNSSSVDISSVDEELARDLSAILSAPPRQNVAPLATPGDDASDYSSDISSFYNSSDDDSSSSADISFVDKELASDLSPVLSAPPRQSVAPLASPGNDASDCSSEDSSSDDSSDDDSNSSDISSVDEELARDLSAVLSAPPRQSVASCAPPGDGASDYSSDISSFYNSSDDDSSSSDISSADEELARELLAVLSPQRRSVAPRARPASTQRTVVADSADLSASSGFDSADENRLASIRADLLKIGSVFAGHQCAAFRERAHVLASINFLARNVPSYVLDHLGRELRSNHDTRKMDREYATLETASLSIASDRETGWDFNNEDSSVSSSSSSDQSLDETFHSEHGLMAALPYVTPLEGAVLFGFTELSARVGSENVSTALNDYFKRLVKLIFMFGGDIQKFVGDALFAEWRVTPSRSLVDCARLAAMCTCQLARDLKDFPVTIMNGSSLETIQMNCRCGLGIGRKCVSAETERIAQNHLRSLAALFGIHIGDDECRRQYLHVGDPIVQATDACLLAASGEVVLSTKFFEVFSRTVSLCIVANDQGNGKITLTACGDDFESQAKNFRKRPEEIARSRAITHHVEGLNLDDLKEYRRLIALYCHPVVRHGSNFNRTKSTRASHCPSRDDDDDDEEMRNVFVAFLNAPVPLHRTAGSGKVHISTVNKINRIINLVSRELLHFKGHFEAFIDEKGFSFMITFGLRGSTFPNLVSAVALPAVLTIQQVLATEAKVNCHIGATYGKVHCGFLGTSQRHEYTVLGPPVNLAARLMKSDSNRGLLVDESVRSVAGELFTFDPIGKVRAKGYSDSIMTFTPLIPGSIGHTQSDKSFVFVGRQTELDTIQREAAKASSRSGVLLISGASGIGKSTVLTKAISTAFDSPAEGKRVEMVHICCDAKSSFVPFAALQSLLQSVHPFTSGMTSYCLTHLTLVNHHRRPWEVFRRLLLKFTDASEVHQELMTMNQRELFALSHCIFEFLSQHIRAADRFVMAIDDCHRLDTFSWRTLGMLLKANTGIFLIGTATNSSSQGFRMDDETKELIFDRFSRAGHLSILELQCLPMGDVSPLIAQSLGLHEVSDELLHNVYAESGGHPLFVQQVIRRIKEGPKADLCEELIVHRLDCLTRDERRCLAVASCFGATFTTDEIHQILAAEDDSVSLVYCASTLQALAQIDILRDVNGNSNNAAAAKIPDAVAPLLRMYCFRDVRWRQKMLQIMLQSAQRDVARLLATQRRRMHASSADSAP